MAIWDLGFFDNNMACDWENGITENSNLDYIVNSLTPVINNKEEFLDIDLSCKALGACEALARLNKKQGESSSYTEHLDKWVEQFVEDIPNETIKLAIQCIDKISSEDSELKQYWTLRGEKDKWMLKLNKLKERLTVHE